MRMKEPGKCLSCQLPVEARNAPSTSKVTAGTQTGAGLVGGVAKLAQEPRRPELQPMPLAPSAEPQYFRFEGVWLTETGMAVLRNLTMSPLHKRRQRKTRPGALNGEGSLEGSDPLGPDEKKEGDLEGDELLKAEGARLCVGPCCLGLQARSAPWSTRAWAQESAAGRGWGSNGQVQGGGGGSWDVAGSSTVSLGKLCRGMGLSRQGGMLSR